MLDIILGAIVILIGIVIIVGCIYVALDGDEAGIAGAALGLLCVFAGIGIVYITFDHTGIVYNVSNFTEKMEDKSVYNIETKEIVTPEKTMKRIIIHYENDFYLMETEDYEYLSLKEGDSITFCYGEVEEIDITLGDD